MSEQVITLQMKFDNISDSDMQDILVNLEEMKKYLLVEENNGFNIKNFYEIKGEITDDYIDLQDKIEEFLNIIKKEYLTIGFYGMVTLDDSVTGSFVDLYKKYPNSNRIIHTEYEYDDADIEFFDKYEKDKKYKKSIVENINHSQKYLIFFNEVYYLLEYRDCIEVLENEYRNLAKDLKFMNDDELCDLLSKKGCVKYLQKYIISKDIALELVKDNYSNNQTNKDCEKFLSTNIKDYLNNFDTKKIMSNYFENVKVEGFLSFEELLSFLMVKDCELALKFWKDILSKNKNDLSKYYVYKTLVFEPTIKLLKNSYIGTFIEALVEDEFFMDLVLAKFYSTGPKYYKDKEEDLIRYRVLKEIALNGYHDVFVKIMSENFLIWEDNVLIKFIEEAKGNEEMDKSLCIDLIKSIKDIPLPSWKRIWLSNADTLYRRLGCYVFEIAGTEHRRKTTFEKHAEEGTRVKFVPEPTNEYDKNAIKVKTVSGKHLGYIPKSLAAEIHDAKNYIGNIISVYCTLRGIYRITVEAIPRDKDVF